MKVRVPLAGRSGLAHTGKTEHVEWLADGYGHGIDAGDEADGAKSWVRRIAVKGRRRTMAERVRAFVRAPLPSVRALVLEGTLDGSLRQALEAVTLALGRLRRPGGLRNALFVLFIGLVSACAPAPDSTPTARTVGLFLNEPGAFVGYTLFNRVRSKTIYLIDNQGRVVHTWELEANALFAKLLENGNLLTFANRGEGFDIQRRDVTEVDPNGNVVQECHQGGPHHDFLKMPNGNVLLLSRQKKTAEEAIAAGANPELVSTDGLNLPHIVEARPTGPASCEIVWEWSVWDHLIQDLDSSKANYGVVAEHPELIDLNFRPPVPNDPQWWMRSNGIDYNAELDQIVLTVRFFGEAWIIDHSTTTSEAAGHSGGKGGKGGDLLYRWGNPRAYRAGTPEHQQLFRPHNSQWIAAGLPGAGNILIFNNGAEVAEFQRGYSSVDEIAPPVDGANYRLDPDSAYGPAEPVWVYTAERPGDFFAPFISGTQRLPNGNTLICDGVHGTLFEVTPAGKTVWKYINPRIGKGPLRQGESVPLEMVQPGVETLGNLVYRAYRYAPNYPGLQGLDLTPGEPIELYSTFSPTRTETMSVSDGVENAAP